MESGRVQCIADKDLQMENEDFCKMWRCRCYNIGYSCHWCPILTDLKLMASAFNLRFQINETSFEKNSPSFAHQI
jgi:hypothetical protein